MMIQAFVLVATVEAAFGLIAYAARTGAGRGGRLHRHLLHRRQDRRDAGLGRITGTTGMAATFIGGFFSLTRPGRRRAGDEIGARSAGVWIGVAVVIFVALLFTLDRTPIGLAAVAVAVSAAGGHAPAGLGPGAGRSGRCCSCSPRSGPG